MLPTLVLAALLAASPPPERLFYAVDDAAGLAALAAHGAEVDVLAPQVLTLEADGTLTGAVPSALAAAARACRIPLVPLVVNPGFRPEPILEVLDSPERQARAIAALLSRATAEGWAGVQFDFEHIPAAARDRYTSFVRATGAAFRAAGLSLSVAVVAQHSQEPGGYPPGFWEEWAGVFDYAALADAADFLSLMAYDQHTRLTGPGPVAGLPWVEAVLAHALAQVAPAKLSLGIPLYYRAWRSRGGPGYGGFREAQALREALGVSARWDPTQRTPFFVAAGDATVTTVWYEDARSIAQRLALVRRHGLRGFSAWVLGQEDPAAWTLLQGGSTDGDAPHRRGRTCD
ncbi:MAG: glycosyl hydrolase family 18 protein [Candidatus Methylomirabilales bacterium]